MTRSRFVFLTVSLLTLLLVAGGRIAASSTRQKDDGSDSLYKYLAVFTEVLGLVKRAYVDEPKVDDLMDGAFEGATDALGPFAHYVPEEHLAVFRRSREVGSSRSGLLVLKDRGMTFVANVHPGGPAAVAGVQRDDVIAILQGRNTREMPLWEAQSILAGAVGTEIRMQVIRLAQKSQLSFTLGEVPSLAVELSESRGLGILKIASMDNETVKNVRVSLETLSQGSEDLAAIEDRSRLVLDLRGVAAGSPAAAYGVAELFTKGELGVLINRAEVLEVFAAEGEAKWSGRLAVLVDHGTLGAAELLATILKQNLDAVLVGEPTFGHTGRESLVALSNGGSLQITDAFYTGPDRKPISSSLTPDRRVSSRLLLGGPAAKDGDDPKADPVLDKALEVLLDEEDVVEKKSA